MQAVSADLRVPKPTPGDLKRSSLNIGVLEEFAQNMAGNIIRSFVSQVKMVELEEEDCMSSSAGVDPREVCRNIEDHRGCSERSTGVKVYGRHVKNPSLLNESTMTEGDPQPCCPPLSQSGLPVVGSLDYPDAPPTTPLLPELERNRQSFDRKLKGGLANVFLPSPPPTTPKFKDSDPNEVELMEHLMHSLSTEDLAREYLAAGAQHGAEMEAFAEALSCGIIDWMLSGEKMADDNDLHVLAQQLAETIITSSLDEAKTLV